TLGRFLGLADANCKPEEAAFSRFTLDADFPAHELDQVATDGQTQPGTSVLSSHGCISLPEGLEQLVFLRRCHPDAGVLHFETEAALISLGLDQTRAHKDVAVLGQ